jgi:hypothetical protein
MNSLAIVFLGIIAVAALLQAAFFIAAAYFVLRATARVDALADRAEREWPGLVQRVTEATSDLVEASRNARAAAERAQKTVEMVATATDRASDTARRAAQLPLVPLRMGGALWQAVRRAVDVYRHPDRTPAP